MTDIKVISRDEVEISGTHWCRDDLKSWIGNATNDPVLILGWREILRLMDAYEEPAPKWEPCPFETGMVIRHKADGRLVLLGNARPAKVKDVKWTWETTDLSTGEVHWFDPHSEVWEVHRLPHEFKVGDWFECDTPACKGKIFQVDRVSGDAVRSRLDSLGTYGDWHPANKCRPVPPPREEKPSQEIDIDECVGKRELRGDCIFECTGTIKDGLRWKQVLTKDQLDDAISKAVETSEKPEIPFTKIYRLLGDALLQIAKNNREIADLRDELTRILKLLAGKSVTP